MSRIFEIFKKEKRDQINRQFSFGVGDGARSRSLLIHSQTLCQLSYAHHDCRKNISPREVSSGILSLRFSLIKHSSDGSCRLRSGDSQLLASRQILKCNHLFGKLVWA